MNFNKKKRNYLIPSVTIFCILYIILAMRPTGTEIHFTPEWTEDIHHIREANDGDTLIPYRLSNSFGYFTEDGRISSHMDFQFKSAISHKWYCTYLQNNTYTDFFLADGTKAGTITEAGFPFIDDDRIYLMLPGGTSFAKLSATGERQWAYENYSPLTAFSSSKGGTVAGYADGSIISFDSEGKVSQKFNPGGSDIEVILGADISEDGNIVACVSGQDNQRFVVAERNSGHSRIIYHEYLGSQLNRQTLVKFTRKSDFVYYNFKDGLGIVNLSNSTSKKIPIKGKITQIEFSDDDELVFVLSRDRSTYTITVLEKNTHQMASFSFAGESSFIQTRKNSLFIGRNNKISRISISRK
ncbi:hypothetical protein [Treponema sp.]|uniref:hypothetical protein n=1 Tax=Treponema sp. TaxID=166 RepID=UPI00388F4153